MSSCLRLRPSDDGEIDGEPRGERTDDGERPPGDSVPPGEPGEAVSRRRAASCSRELSLLSGGCECRVVVDENGGWWSSTSGGRCCSSVGDADGDGEPRLPQPYGVTSSEPSSESASAPAVPPLLLPTLPPLRRERLSRQMKPLLGGSAVKVAPLSESLLSSSWTLFLCSVGDGLVMALHSAARLLGGGAPPLRAGALMVASKRARESAMSLWHTSELTRGTSRVIWQWH